MQITNLTSNVYLFPGFSLGALEVAVVPDDWYLLDDGFRHKVNLLLANSKISVADTPDGFPIVTAADAEASAEGAANGGSQTVSVVLGADVSAIDLATATGFRPQFPITWPTLYDDTVSFTEIFAMPDGMGISFTPGGSDFTTTESGVWWVGCAVNLPQDATLGGVIGPRGIGILDTQFGPGVLSPDSALANAQTYLAQCGELIYIPSATTFHYFIEVDQLPTADPYLPQQATMTLLRIA